jgi:hypothetical protein
MTLRTRIRLRAASVVLLAAALLPAPLPAVTPVLWTVETLEEFERGKPDGISMSPMGELVLSPALSAVNIPPLE